MSNPYQPYQTPQPSGQPSPWAHGSGFGNPPAHEETLDVLSGSSYQPYAQPTANPEPAGLAAPQFPGATQYVPAPVQPGGVQPYYGFGQAPEHPNSSTVLTLGIVSLFFAATGPFAWYLGSKARREMRENPGRWRESSSLTAGWVLGIISSILIILAVALVVFFILGIALFAAAG